MLFMYLLLPANYVAQQAGNSRVYAIDAAISGFFFSCEKVL